MRLATSKRRFNNLTQWELPLIASNKEFKDSWAKIKGLKEKSDRPKKT